MKKITFVLSFLMLTFGLCACDNSSQETNGENKKVVEAVADEISPNKIYYFYQNTCPHCHHAIEYINKKHPDLNMVLVNIGIPGGYDLFVKCAEKFKLGNSIGTPLFCMGDNYLMGWAPEYESKFDEYIKPFTK